MSGIDVGYYNENKLNEDVKNTFHANFRNLRFRERKTLEFLWALIPYGANTHNEITISVSDLSHYCNIHDDRVNRIKKILQNLQKKSFWVDTGGRATLETWVDDAVILNGISCKIEIKQNARLYLKNLASV